MRVKICGIMRPGDVKAAIDSGADAVGFVVGSPDSERNLNIEKARGLMNSVPVFASKVAVTSANSTDSVLRICTRLEPDVIQLHQHTRGMVRALRRHHPDTRIVLSTPIHDSSSIVLATQSSSYSDAILADSPSIKGVGGTGHSHDWSVTANVRKRISPHPLILAGGLTPRNVKQAIQEVRPYAVDVSTGVEKRVGVKDHEMIKEFVSNAKET